MHDLYGADLADEGPHDAVGLIILELTDVDLKCCHVHESDSNFAVKLFENQDPFWLVTLGIGFEGSTGGHRADLSVHDLLGCVGLLALLTLQSLG